VPPFKNSPMWAGGGVNISLPKTFLRRPKDYFPMMNLMGDVTQPFSSQGSRVPPPSAPKVTGQRGEKCVYIAPCCPLKKPQLFFRLRRAVSEMCIWPFEPSKKTPNCFSPAAACLKNVYMTIWSVVRLWPEFFSLRKKSYFHLCLIVCPILFCPLILCHLVQSFVICSLSGGKGQGTKMLISYLHQGGGILLPCFRESSVADFRFLYVLYYRT
jgi:hypothetical protein